MNDFKKASADPKPVADLMIYYVQQGIACTTNYGDIHEGFYSSLESVFSEAISLIKKSNNVDLFAEFYPPLERIVKNTRGIG